MSSAMIHDRLDPDYLLRHIWGYPAFHGPQREIIDHITKGGDALVLMSTGSGKSLCYQIPSLMRPGLGVVVSPLIALMQNQVAALDQLGVRAAYLNSSLDAQTAQEVQRRARAGELDMLYMSPERLVSASGQRLLDQCRLALFAIDEAHCVSQWGHDFRPEYGQLSLIRERWPDVPRIALTATADVPTRQEIIERLLVAPREFVASFDRPNIRYRIVEKQDPRQQLLNFIRNEHRRDAGVVYTMSRNTVEEVAAMLASNSIDALPYHAGMDTARRAEYQRQFLDRDGVVMVATTAFGMGIDKPDVRFVAHLDMPRSIEGYFQETGRAGRDGLPAQAWMAYGLSDVVQQRRMIDLSEAEESYKRLSTVKLDAMLALAETADCRRTALLAYFGQTGTACGNCDNCLQPPDLVDMTEPARKLLSCIYRCSQASQSHFAAGHVIDVLRGKLNERIEKFNHQSLSTFGIGADIPEADWRQLLRYLASLHVVEIDAMHFNVLRLTEQSREVLSGKQRIMLKRRLPSTNGKRRSGKAGNLDRQELPPLELALFEKLRAWRSDIAKSLGVPAYVVFPDNTLHAIAMRRPATLDELREVSGVGDKKRDNYGTDIIALVAM